MIIICDRCSERMESDYYVGGDHDPTHYCPKCGVHYGCSECGMSRGRHTEFSGIAVDPPVVIWETEPTIL